MTQGPAPQMFRLLQNMLGKTLGCSSPGVTPPDLSWGFVAAPPVSPRLRCPHMEMEMELLLATPLCQALSCGRQWDFGEEVLFFFFPL